MAMKNAKGRCMETVERGNYLADPMHHVDVLISSGGSLVIGTVLVHPTRLRFYLYILLLSVLYLVGFSVSVTVGFYIALGCMYSTRIIQYLSLSL